jgi:hypothetical protein
MTQAEIIKAIELAVAKAMATTKVQREPPPRDMPNAPMPDIALAGDDLAGGMPQLELAAWRAPAELRGMTIHTAAGAMQVPSHGVVQTRLCQASGGECGNCLACAVHKELRGRGFSRMQSVKRASEIVGDEIRAVLASGTARGRAMDAARNLDKTGALAAEAGADVTRWLSKRNEMNFPQPEVTRWTPREEFIARMVKRGHTLRDAEKLANGEEI